MLIIPNMLCLGRWYSKIAEYSWLRRDEACHGISQVPFDSCNYLIPSPTCLIQGCLMPPLCPRWIGYLAQACNGLRTFYFLLLKYLKRIGWEVRRKITGGAKKKTEKIGLWKKINMMPVRKNILLVRGWRL